MCEDFVVQSTVLTKVFDRPNAARSAPLGTRQSRLHTQPSFSSTSTSTKLSLKHLLAQMSFLGGRGSTPAGQVNPERVEVAIQECVPQPQFIVESILGLTTILQARHDHGCLQQARIVRLFY